MDVVLATLLVSLILVVVWRVMPLTAQLGGTLLALMQGRRHARLAQAEMADIDAEYAKLVARHR